MLVELAKEDYARVEPLFGPQYPNLAFVHGVLDEKLPGRVWVHEENGVPVACLIATLSPFCFAAGTLTRAFFDQARILLGGRGTVQIVHPAEPGIGELAAGSGFTPALRRQFSQPRAGWSAPEPALPDGFELVRIDAALFDRLDSPMARSIFGSGADYAEHAIGFALRKDGRIVADAHGVVGGGLSELGTFAHPDYRGLGLPSFLLAEVARWSAKNGLRVVITCAEDKHASIAMAHRLGLTEDFLYPVAELAC
ncbi:GNAT family N-acetyltransferase [Streptomyces syringium]|uniref:GNAT family N-acetyltransferase n=1 Tax=Streptomyces syringium TaxID=76729 RepID=UPI0034555DB3